MKNKIFDIKIALKNGAYQSALALSLTLPDICSQVWKQKNKTDNKDYIDWCNTYLNYNEINVGFGTENATIHGEETYALRCAFLHNGNEDIKSQKAANNTTITKLHIVKPNELDGYGFLYKVNNSTGDVDVTFDVEQICILLCDAAEKFYNQHNKPSDFINQLCSFEL